MTDSALYTELNVLKKEKRKWQAKNNLTQFAHTCNAIGEIYMQQGKYEDSLDEHKEELRACERVKDVIGTAVANRKIGECYNELGDYDDALQYQFKHLELAQSVNNSIETQRAWATIGRTYLCQAESLEHNKDEEYNQVLEKSENAFMKSLDICKSLTVDLVSQKELMAMKGRLYLNLGLIYDYKGDLNKCSDLIKQAIHVNEVYDLKEDLNRCQYSLASIYYRSGQCRQALRIIDEAHASAVKLKDVILQAETVLLKSKILFQISDFDGAKYHLKKAYKLNTPNEIIYEEIKKLLRISINLCSLEKELELTPSEDHKAKLKIYEKLGDLCAKFECFSLSLDFYNKMLECAQTLNESESAKATIYFSLAETYFDLDKYDNAEKYYFKELEARDGNFKEQCKTWLNLAECHLRQKRDYNDLKETYFSATYCAKKANDVKLEMSCLKNLIRIQEIFNETDEKLQNQQLLENLMSENNVQSDDEEDSQSQNLSQTFDLLDLSDSSSDSENDNEEYDRPRKARRKISTKKNEKGETPLHRACIAGNLNQVCRLIEKGHPINPRDNCGWIPLHEAANHDHYEIVKYLLEKGAAVNDRGGAFCDGITPLHDAASCGNFGVMRLLVDHGASAIAKMDNGDMALDCLKKWRDRVGEDLDSQLINEYTEMRDKLLDVMGAIGEGPSGVTKKEQIPSTVFRNLDDLVTCQSDDDEKERTITKCAIKRSSLESFSDEENNFISLGRKRAKNIVEETDENSDSEVEEVNVDNADDDIDDPAMARREYMNAIDSVRSATSRIQDDNFPLDIATEKKTALVNEDDVIVDDWLEDDIGPTNKKTKISWPVLQPAFKANNKVPSRFRRPKMRQLKFTVLRNSRSESNSPVDNLSSDGELSDFRETEMQPSSSSARPINQNTGSNVQTSNYTSSMRVRVRIEGKLLLIPINQSDLEQTVSWLAEEASTRYHQLFGLKPVLSLCTHDGAVLGTTDKVTQVIAGNEELAGVVDNWDLQPLPNRYLSSCESLNAEPFHNVRQLLESASLSNDLILIDLGLTPSHARVLFRALQCQYALRHLSLVGNDLGNTGLQMLANIVYTLPNLTCLNLSCNNISSLQSLCDAITSKNNQEIKPLQALTDLYLNYNSLETSVSSLSSLISSLPRLTHLEIACCSLDSSCLSKRNPLSRALTGCSNLRHVNISFNVLSVDGVDALLQSLRPGQVTSLDFTGVLSGEKSVMNNKLAASLKSFFNEGNCVLEDLSLKDCQISDEVVSQIALCVQHLPRLNQLCLANNTDLSEASLIALTNSFIQNRSLKLQCTVDFSGCVKIISRLSSSVLSRGLQYWLREGEISRKNKLKLKWNST